MSKFEIGEKNAVASRKVKLGRPKSEQKRQSILKSAEKLILELGYSATSMDLVATKAKVSKQTVYSHFKNKESLFTAIIMLKCEQYQLDADSIDSDKELFDALFEIGLRVVKLWQQDEVVAMYRVVIAEVSNNPKVAKLFYEAGPQQGANLLAEFFMGQPSLKFSEDESHTWANTFLNLLKGDFHFRSILGLSYKLSDKQQEQEVAKAVTNFRKLIVSK